MTQLDQTLNRASDRLIGMSCYYENDRDDDRAHVDTAPVPLPFPIQIKPCIPVQQTQ